MALPILAVAVAKGAGLFTMLRILFSYAAAAFFVRAAVFALIALIAYAVTSWIFPSWLSLAGLREQLESFSPPLAYALDLLAFYDGVFLIFSALSAAWILKKLPLAAWLGALFRAKG